ncbi:MAG: SAM-dependent methyltransferase [Candidatus Accumulibacter sp.]|nr:SAM-dependent methyltransferase [Accumulibacter sp.]MBA4093251.1 SAM-dependent methyltransferase [Accumulibacter sp.]
MHFGRQAAIGARAFRHIQALFHAESGIHLAEGKQALVASRLRKRLEALGLADFDAYCAFIEGGEGGAERRLLIDLLTTNETYFFREPMHFGHLAENVLPTLPGRGVRIWCAAASSGEEPYSIAMTLDAGLGHADWEIVGTDLSRRVLARAADGLYPMARIDHLPPDFLKRYCLRGTGAYAGMLRIAPQLRARMRFAEHNLLHRPTALGQFDVIFLRNVLIYFDAPTRERIVRQALDALRPGGWLYIGRAESLHGLALPLAGEQPSIYRKLPCA